MREQVEWTNSWIQDANEGVKPRVLLIGDSVTRQIRKSFNEVMAKRGYAVDLFACSYTVFDNRFRDELSHFFSETYRYETILFMDIHHRTSFERCSSRESTSITYKELLIEIYYYLRLFSERVIICTTTPYRTDYEDDNIELKYRNNIIRSIDIFSGYIDLWELVESHKPYYVDHVHFDNAYNTFFALEIICKMYAKEEDYPFPIFINDFSQLMKLTDTFVIVGYGKKGRLLGRYFEENGIVAVYTASEEFLNTIPKEKRIIRIHEIENNQNVILTTYDKTLELDLLSNNIQYSFLTDDLYNKIQDYYLFGEEIE